MKTAREIIAKAAAVDAHGSPEARVTLPDRAFADAILAALAAEGFSIVETGRDPVTDAMVESAHDAFYAWPADSGDWVGRMRATINAALSRSTKEGKTE